MARKPKVPKAKKQRSKRVTYQLIKPDSKEGKPIFVMLNELIEKHHEHLTNARIALAWNTTWKADVDGHTKLGQTKKASDLDRELAPYDFVIMLRKEFFEMHDTTEAQKRALLDHELCHADCRYDREGEPLVDAKGRTIYRLRKHDLEEFSAVVGRHGIYKRDIEAFFSAAKRDRQGNLVDITGRKRPGNGTAVEDESEKGERAALDRLQKSAAEAEA